tara:strand:+ start:1820 stop:1939 length:120 start_codon:yes stop_codon:yes gene_type:complete
MSGTIEMRIAPSSKLDSSLLFDAGTKKACPDFQGRLFEN